MIIDNNLYFEKLGPHEDEYYIPKALFYSSQVGVCMEVLYNYRIREGALTSQKSIINALYKLEVAEKLCDFFTKNNAYSKSMHKNIYIMILNAVREAIFTKKEKELQKKFTKKLTLIFKEAALTRKQKLWAFLISINIYLFNLVLQILSFKKQLKRCFL